MSALYDEFEAQLAAWQLELRDRPAEQMLRLTLLALEREELVAVAYRESLLAERLAQTTLPEPVREAIRYALLWIWKDEQMHTVYLRGALLRLGGPLTRSRTAASQISGAVGGWASSILQHVRWRDQPMVRLLAAGVTGLGMLSGKVPPSVRRTLDHLSLRDYCRYNVEAERTAALGFARMLDLVDPNRDGLRREHVQQMTDDEARHARIFAMLAELLDEHDRVTSGRAGDELVERLREVGEVFLPPRHRRTTAREPVPGRGGEVHVVSGEPGEDAQRAFDRLLDRVTLEERVHRRAVALAKPISEVAVCIKTSFMLGYSRSDVSPIVHPAFVERLAQRLRSAGCASVTVLDAPNLYDRFFAHRSVREVARYFGLRAESYRVADAAEDSVPHAYVRGLALRSISRSWRDADFRITFGKMRSHPTDICYLSVANLEGVGMRQDEHLFVERQVHRETAVMMVLAEFPTDLALLDAYAAAPDGLVGVMGSRVPRSPRRLYGAADPVALDLVAARHMASDPIADCGFLRAAVEWFGDPTRAVRVIGLDQPIADWRGPRSTQLRSVLSALAYPVYVFASGRGSLFVPPMDPAAFPPLMPESPLLRVTRHALRRLVALPVAS